LHLGAFDVVFAAIAVLLVACYALTGSYGGSIVALSVAVNTLTTPLTVRGWRAQQARARLQPELDRLRRRHANDRQRLATETAALFREHGVSPLAGCLPALLSAPLYFAMYKVIRGLTQRATGSALFRPRYLPHSSRLFHALAASTTMPFWGVDLARTGAAALQFSPLSAGVFVGLVAITVGAGICQQHLARPPVPQTTDFAPAAPRAVLFLPALFAIWGLALPLAVTLSYTTASLVRLGQQAILLKAHPW
jgi:YidC/Oxa1 family membrane protein insertase